MALILLIKVPFEASSSGKDRKSFKGGHGFDSSQEQWNAKLIFLIILITNCFL